MKNTNLSTFYEDELVAIYQIIKDYKNKRDENPEETFYGDSNETVNKKIVKKLVIKLGQMIPKNDKEVVDKSFLRQQFHSFNHEYNGKVYSIMEQAFDKRKTIQIGYFNMERAVVKKREIDMYYKSIRYIIGYCHLRKAVRKFRTSRIVTAKMTNKDYVIPTNFNKNNY